MKSRAAAFGALLMLPLAPNVALSQLVDDTMQRALLASHGQTLLESSTYFHDGVANTLRAAIRHHNDPLNLAGVEDVDGTRSWNIGKRSSLSYILAGGLKLTDAEIDHLIAFLQTLEDGLADRLPDIVPTRVPSDLPVATLYYRK